MLSSREVQRRLFRLVGATFFAEAIGQPDFTFPQERGMSSTLDVPAMQPVSLAVKFGKVSFGAETISVSVSLARGAVPVRAAEPAIAAADRLLTMRRLDVVLTNATDQGDLFAEHEDGAPIEVRTIVETAGLSAGDKFSFTMNARQADLEQSQMDDITHLAQREGRVIIYDVSAKVDAEPSLQPKQSTASVPSGPSHIGTLIGRFASEKKYRTPIGELMDAAGELICNDKQAAAFAESGYATTIEVAELLTQDADAAPAVLSNVKGVSKALAAKVIAAVRKFVERNQKPDGRLLCLGCGELWDTFTGGDGNVIGVAASRELQCCPHCEDPNAAFKGVTDERIDPLGDWPDEVCERIELAQIGVCTVGILLVQDEFGTWRHGVAIDLRGELAGFSPRFSTSRNDRPSAISQARSDVIHELRELDDPDAAACLRAVASDKTPIV